MNLILMKSGSLKIKDDTLCFQEMDAPPKSYPIEAITNIYAFQDISVSSNAFKALKSHRINLFIYNSITKEYMEFLNNNNYQGNTLVNQVKYYLDEEKKTYIAKQIVNAEINNLSYSLLAYRNISIDLKYFKDKRKKVFQETSSNRIMLYEALALKKYYEYIDLSLRNYDFVLPGRHPYHPIDPVNQMITFLNAVLYNEILSYIVECGLNPAIGYNHSSNDRKYTLQLDIADIYKPIIVEKTILTLIHNKVIKQEDFKFNEPFSRELKTKLLNGFYKRIRSTIFINNRYMSYQDIIKQDIYKLRNYINGKTNKIVFFKTRF